ncbi:MAG TPA: hypothetical protein ENH82_18910 [bacterium]|nr:hypothetical protein [bacterium]
MVSENKAIEDHLWEAYEEWINSAEGCNKIKEAGGAKANFPNAEMVDVCPYSFAGYAFEAGYKLAVKRLRGACKIIMQEVIK